MNERYQDLSAEEQALDEQMKDDDALVLSEDDRAPEQAEQEAPEAAEEKAERPDKGYVPLQALDAERGKRKDAEERLRTLESRLDQYLPQQGVQQPGQPEAQPDPRPDPVTHPDEFGQWLDRQFEAKTKPVAEMRQHAEAQARQQQAQAALRNYAVQSEQAFREQHTDKDYDGALQFARERKAEEFRLWGYQDADIPQLIRDPEAMVTAMAHQRGVNPAAYIYNYALLNGFSAGQQAAEDPGEKVERLGEAERQTRSAASAGGAPRREEWTAEALDKLSEDELAKVPDEVFAKVMGA